MEAFLWFLLALPLTDLWERLCEVVGSCLSSFRPLCEQLVIVLNYVRVHALSPNQHVSVFWPWEELLKHLLMRKTTSRLESELKIDFPLGNMAGHFLLKTIWHHRRNHDEWPLLLDHIMPSITQTTRELCISPVDLTEIRGSSYP